MCASRRTTDIASPSIGQQPIPDRKRPRIRQRLSVQLSRPRPTHCVARGLGCASLAATSLSAAAYWSSVGSRGSRGCSGRSSHAGEGGGFVVWGAVGGRRTGATSHSSSKKDMTYGDSKGKGTSMGWACTGSTVRCPGIRL